MLASGLGTAARQGWHVRRVHGPPPDDIEVWPAWAWQHFRVLLSIDPRVPHEFNGAAQLSSDHRALGVIVLRDGCPYPRWSFAHELGHLKLGAVHGFDLAIDAWRTTPDERAANQFATTYLLDPGAALDALYAGATTSYLAHQYGVPEEAIHMRLQLSRLLRI